MKNQSLLFYLFKKKITNIQKKYIFIYIKNLKIIKLYFENKKINLKITGKNLF